MKSSELYFFDPLTEHFVKQIKVDKIYFQGKTKYQFIQCFRNRFLGKVLFVDGKIQSAKIDEFIYHESLVHPALITHPLPRQVLVVGGGEGATLREVLKHRTVKRVTMVDIDKDLVEVCQKHLPEWSAGAFSNPKVELAIGNARRFVEETEKRFDVVISDLTEPLKQGPSVFLFTQEFFEKVFKILNAEGVFVLQAGSTDSFHNQFFCSLAKTLERIFPLVRPYWTFILSFGQPWGFVLASKKEDPLALEESDIGRILCRRGVKKLKYYHPGLHKSVFSLPLYLIKKLKKGRILKDSEPFIWKI